MFGLYLVGGNPPEVLQANHAMFRRVSKA